MADVTQEATILLAHALLTNADSRAGLNFVGTEKDVRTFLSAQIYVYHAPIETAVNDPGIDYILQGRWSTGVNVNEDWIDLWKWTTGTVAAVAAEIAGAEAAGQTTIDVDADPTANFTPGSKIYIEDKGTVADGEWNAVAHSEAAGPDSVTILDGLTNAKDNVDTMWTQAESFSGSVDLSGISYVRMIVQGSDTTGVNFHYKAHMIAFTDFE